MILDILNKSKNEKKFIGIWLYGDDEGFWSGYVKDYNEDLVILQHYSKYGKPDGVIIEEIENIESIDFDDDYSKAMEYIIDHADELDYESEINLKIKHPDQWQKEILDDQIGKKDRIVRIEVNQENTCSGLVEWSDNNNVVIHRIGKEGQDEGRSLFKIEDISSIRINDIENRKKLMLFNWRLGKNK